MSERRDVCFVVMPFGEKPIPDSGGATYDFDKVYRVLLGPAIRRAGLEPVRADEVSGSHLIHTDMFEHLRDRAVVLVDLSLANPNVYYELGVRHVMASRGTVLTCRTDTELPFDIALSRVIFYEFDGRNLDWEEAERKLDELHRALEEAAKQRPADSPVHALLEQVLPAHELSRYALDLGGDASADTDESLDHFQQVVAEAWVGEGREPTELLDDVGSSVFGCRALGRLCLRAPDLPEGSRLVARRLYGVGQYDLAGRIFERLGDDLDFGELLAYGSAISEENPSEAGAEQGLEKLQDALDDACKRKAPKDLFSAQSKVAGLLAWKWELSKEPADLEAAIDALREADDTARGLLDTDGFSEVGRVAQARLRLLLLLRTRAGDRGRPDEEGLRESILDLVAPDPHPAAEEALAARAAEEASYLHWYQAITLADADDARAHDLAVQTYGEDRLLAAQRGHERIGRRQYTQLRRFIDHYSKVFQHPVKVAQISQVLQLGHTPHPTPDRDRPFGRVVM